MPERIGEGLKGLITAKVLDERLPIILQSEIWDIRLGKEDFPLEHVFTSGSLQADKVDGHYRRIAEELLFAFGPDLEVRKRVIPLLADALKSKLQMYVAQALGTADKPGNESRKNLDTHEAEVRKYVKARSGWRKHLLLLNRNEKTSLPDNVQTYAVAINSLSLQMDNDLRQLPTQSLIPLLEASINDVKQALERGEENTFGAACRQYVDQHPSSPRRR